MTGKSSGPGTGTSILTIGILAIGAYSLWKFMPYLIGYEVATTALGAGEEARIAQTKKAIIASEVSAPIGGTGPTVSYKYNYEKMYQDLPVVPKAFVGTGMAISEWTGIDATKKGAELRSAFETKMIVNEGTSARFNALPDWQRGLVRLGEGVGNLFGFSPYQAGFDIANPKK